MGSPIPARSLRTFLGTEVAGGIALLGATIAALVWVNSPFGDTYASFWGREIGTSLGRVVVREDLRHWVNDALMTLFFFVVGLEIKRELVAGELRGVRRAALPAVAALGGMVVPAAIYLAINLGGPRANGWGIPMATDIAFAVGVLALLGSRVPPGLKVFLLSLAIVDDIGAIVVIALFYSSGISLGWLAAALGGLVAVALLRRAGVTLVPVYGVAGATVWFAMFSSGVHATIAGVALGLLTPALPDPGSGGVSVAERLESRLHPWTGFVIVPLFALANAGIALDGGSVTEAATSSVAVGVAAGLVVGKIAGVFGASWLAVRLGIGVLPEGVTPRHMLGVSAVAGIGFTVSLFIANLAFTDETLVEAAKLGIFVASLAAGALGVGILRSGPGRGPAEKPNRARRNRT